MIKQTVAMKALCSMMYASARQKIIKKKKIGRLSPKVCVVSKSRDGILLQSSTFLVLRTNSELSSSFSTYPSVGLKDFLKS